MKVYERIKTLVKMITGEVPTSVLISRGMKVGKDFNRQQGSYIDPTHCFLVEIGNNVTFSIRVTVLAHDASTKKSLGYTKIGKVVIGDNVFVGANATILPNVIIGNNSIIGANSVVSKNIPENCVAAGNPARVLSSLEEFKTKNFDLTKRSKVFGKEYRFSRQMTKEKKEELKRATQHGIAFID